MPAVRVPVVTVRLTVPFPVPDAGESDSHAVLLLAVQSNVPPPVLLTVRVWAAGLPLPCWAVKDRLVGLVLIAGLTDSVGAEGGEINCVNSGISSANLCMDRPPPLLLPEVDEFPAPAEASGVVPVGAAPAATDPVPFASGGATLRGRGVAAPTLLLSEDGSLDTEVVLSLGGDGGAVVKELIGKVSDGEGSTDAMGAFCGFRIRLCSLRVEVCASFLSEDFVRYGRAGAIFSMRRL